MHVPVMTDIVIEYLDCRPGGVWVDCTAGEGGHAKQILKRIGPEGLLIAIDRDAGVLEKAKDKLKGQEENVRIFNSNFTGLGEILKELRISKVDGILFDLGLSTFQLEDRSRGFSFKDDGPLDMRMSEEISKSAAYYVNNLDERRLNEAIFRYGEERWAKSIAGAIVRERGKGTIETAGALAEIIRRAIPRSKWPGRIHPATRTFQALRILVNEELEAIEETLPAAIGLLKDKGRICVISFHSLEDRIVKNVFRDFSGRKEEAMFKVLTRKPVVASDEEKRQNPRSRSAKLRAGEVING